MSVRTILQGAGNTLLRAVAKEAERTARKTDLLIEDLCDTAAAAAGVGLAAPQIGIGLRVCVVKMNGAFVPLLNPEIVWKSKEESVMEEGCLSLPDVAVEVARASSITVRYQDRKWKQQERRVSGLEARIVQHEVDHLNGVLIVDYVGQHVPLGATTGEQGNRRTGQSL